jgi:hypothetical protein
MFSSYRQQRARETTSPGSPQAVWKREAPAIRGLFCGADSSKWVLGSASPPPHEARIGLDARIHAL